MKQKSAVTDVLLLAVYVALASVLAFAILTGHASEASWYGVSGVALAISAKASTFLHRNLFISVVEDHDGPCVPVWLNKNKIDFEINGAVTGYFREARKLPGLPLFVPTGPQFHGFIKSDLTVESTEGYYQGNLR